MSQGLDLQNADTIVERLRAGAKANRSASCRQGSIDRITSPGTLIATGDLHDNPVHFEKLVRAAHMADEEGRPAHPSSPALAHLVLHEIIHPDRLYHGMDFSYRALVKVADLKARYPEYVHVLLGNHELAQIAGAGIVKDGVRVVEAFNKGVDYIFGGEAERIHEAIAEFVRSMPLALRVVTPKGDILCSHSLPQAAIMNRFDPGILFREIEEADYQPRTGSAYMMVWGRGYDAEGLEDLVERWGVNLFILGHEKVEHGAMLVPPNAVVLNSDHARGVYLPIDLEHPPRPEEAVGQVVPLGR